MKKVDCYRELFFKFLVYRIKKILDVDSLSNEDKITLILDYINDYFDNFLNENVESFIDDNFEHLENLEII